jgi:hypothetical protein
MSHLFPPDMWRLQNVTAAEEHHALRHLISSGKTEIKLFAVTSMKYSERARTALKVQVSF